MNKVVVRVSGGLGNQLFCYAAARRLALANNAELVIDDETGFVRDHTYRREYALDAFAITARRACDAEKLKPFERLRRKLLRMRSHRMAFDRRPYVDQVSGQHFDVRLLSRRVRGTVWLEGYWQSEDYFKDVEQTIRADLRMAPPDDELNCAIADRISSANAVAVHVRWFDEPGTARGKNVPQHYYFRAMAQMKRLVANPHFFVFSDRPEATRAVLRLPQDCATFVTHNQSTTTNGAVEDFRLMRRCRHFIIANSTFSWWAAWLGENVDTVVIAPSPGTVRLPSWELRGLLPDRWMQL